MDIKQKNPPLIKKNLKTFLLSEEGKMTKRDIVKMTAAIVVVAGALGGVIRPNDALGATCHVSHASHASHGSHSSGGWC